MNTPHKIIAFLDTLKLPYETKVNLKSRIWIRRGGIVIKYAEKLRKYVSHYGLGCFSWKDTGTDKAFNGFPAFLYKNYIKAELEIEVK
jgi:hypothetical protein